MKAKYYTPAIVGFLLLILITSCSDDKRSTYQLRKQCKIDSETFFHEKFSPPVSPDYVNHYNRKLNKCFIIVNEPIIMNSKSLWDVNENKLYGTVYYTKVESKIYCNVFDKKCESIEEWDKLVKPYMEE